MTLSVFFKGETVKWIRLIRLFSKRAFIHSLFNLNWLDTKHIVIANVDRCRYISG